jgi:hypothetical protein
MKVRTSLIFACMIVVPCLALFSHRVPGELRARMRSCLWPPRADSSRQDGAAEIAGDPAGDPAAAGAGRPDPVLPRRADPPPAEPTASNAERLVRLGAVAIDCRPLDGVAGTHVASCRLAVDAAGQLQRLFQAAGSSREEALVALTTVVQDWRQRLDTRAATVADPAAGQFR